MDSLKDLLRNNLNENDINVQRMYYMYFDKIIDACLLIEYDREKRKNFVYSLDQVNDYIVSYLKKINLDNYDYILNMLAHKISYMTNKKEEIPYYLDKLKLLVRRYFFNEKNLNETNQFYNEILNKQQSLYLSKRKNEIVSEMCDIFPLTQKKNQTIINGMKINIFLKRNLVRNIDSDALRKLLTNIHNRLGNNRNLQKNYLLTLGDYEYLDILFWNNELTDKNIMNKFNYYDKRQVKIIKNTYYKQLIPYLEEIKIGNFDIDIKQKNVNFNYNHLKFYNKFKEEENIEDLLAELNLEELKIIMANSERLLVLKQLLPLVGILEKFDIITFKNILIHFSKIKENLKLNQKIIDDTNINQIINNLSLIINLANIYGSVDNCHLNILGEEMINKILIDKITSCSPKKYAYTYLQMLQNYRSTIPPISGEFNDYFYESGNSKIERLMIGKNVFSSCIGPAGAGEKSYYKALYGEDADVLLIKNKKTEKFVGRSLMFRQGNFIIMAPFYGENGIKDDLYEPEFLRQISNQLLDIAKKDGDTLEYIFITRHHALEDSKFIFLEDSRLNRYLPHCDIEDSAYLINSINTKIDLCPYAASHSYLKDRLPVIKKDSNYEIDIKRIESINIMSKGNENYSQEYNCADIYDEVYIGQDWYIGIRDNQVITKCIYEVSDSRQKLEMQQVISMLQEKTSTYQKKLFR